MQCNIDKTALKAVSRFQAIGDIRYYLNGVYVQFNAEQTRLCATDGHIMILHRSRHKGENSRAGGFIMPSATVKQMLGWKAPAKSMSGNPIVLTLPDDYKIGDEIRAEWAGNVTVFKAVDGKFPDVARVIPLTLSGEPAQFNYEYLYRCQQAAQDFNKRNYPSLGMNGNGPALLTINEDCFAVVMPMRNNAAEIENCAWGREPLPLDGNATQELIAA